MTTKPLARVTPDALQKHTLCALFNSLQCASARRSRDDTDDDAQPAPDADADLAAAGRALRGRSLLVPLFAA
eukprot:3712156-Prymnesium_polylepis.1